MTERITGPDMRLPGESFCADCPDREACASAYPCDIVRDVENQAKLRRQYAMAEHEMDELVAQVVRVRTLIKSLEAQLNG